MCCCCWRRILQQVLVVLRQESRRECSLVLDEVGERVFLPSPAGFPPSPRVSEGCPLLTSTHLLHESRFLLQAAVLGKLAGVVLVKLAGGVLVEPGVVLLAEVVLVGFGRVPVVSL